MRNPLWCPTGGLLFVAALAGCGGDSSQEGQTTVELSVVVQAHDFDFVAPSAHSPFGVDRLPFVRAVDLKLRGLSPALIPVADAIIVLDGEAGMRLAERTSDASGRASFTVGRGDWPADDAASITVFKEGYVLHTRAEIARPTDGQPVVLTLHRRWQLPIEERILISGTVLNAPPAQDAAIVSSTAEYGGAQQLNRFRLNTPKDTAASVYALHKVTTASSNWSYVNEVRAGRRDFAAPAVDVTIDVDLEAHAVPLTSVEGSFVLPPRESSPVRSDLTLPVVVGYRGASYWHHPVGWGARLQRAESRVDYAHQTPVDPAEGPNWYRIELRTAAGPWSMIYGRSMAEGAQGQALDIPAWALSGPQSSDDELVWELYDEGVQQQLWIFNETTDEIVWLIDMPSSLRALTLPAPPTGVSLEALTGSRARAVVAEQRSSDGEVGAFLFVSWSAGLPLTPRD